nr:MAG TPA: virion morphogenesis protein [Caudoviricetes sp.]
MAVISEIVIKKKNISIKDIKKFYQKLDKYQATAGIHKDDGQKIAPYTDTRHKDVKLITKAIWFEFGHKIVATVKDSHFKSYLTGEFFSLKPGKTYIQPPRPLIRMYLTKNWKDVKKSLPQEFKKGISGFKNKPEGIFKKVADAAAFWQRSTIYMDELTPKNSSMTIKYKGFDHPGFMTGQLLDNLKGKAGLK